MLKFAFLGTSGAIQHTIRDNASCLVEFQGKSFLIDTGGSVLGKLKQLGCDPLNIEAIFLTHGHIDHLYGFPSLIHQLWLLGRKEALTVYALPEVLDMCEELLAIFSLREKQGIFDLKLTPISDGQSLDFGELKIETMAVQHGLPALAFRFDLKNKPYLYYSGDSVFEPEYADFARGCQIVLHEAAVPDDATGSTRNKGHATARESGLFATLSGAEQLYLFHFGAEYEGRLEEFTEAAKKEFQGEIIIPQELTWYK